MSCVRNLETKSITKPQSEEYSTDNPAESYHNTLTDGMQGCENNSFMCFVVLHH